MQNVKKQKEYILSNKRSKELIQLQKASRIIVGITAIFALLEKLIMLKAQANLSYVESYQTVIAVPTIVKICNSLFEPSVFIFLATLPRKRDTWITLIFYIVVMGVMPVFNGNRAQFGTILLFSICYLLVYYKINKKQFRFKWLFCTVVCGLLLIGFFGIIEQSRGSSTINSISLLAIVENMMDSLGGSDSVIAGIIINAQKFPKNGATYLFFPIKAAIIDNPLSRLIIQLFTGQTVISYPQGLDYVLHNDSFPHWFSYLGSPELYLSGYGSGSSYIAECFFAFGFLGVLLYSAVLGIVVAKISQIEYSNGKVYKNALGLFFLSYLFFLPRDSAFSFATPLLYFLAAIVACQILKILLFNTFTRVSRVSCR